MKKKFMCSLCRSGIVGGTLILEKKSISYKTSKLTVEKAYKNLVLPVDEIVKLKWNRVVFPIATFFMNNGEKYKILIFNKLRFNKWLQKFRIEINEF